MSLLQLMTICAVSAAASTAVLTVVILWRASTVIAATPPTPGTEGD